MQLYYFLELPQDYYGQNSLPCSAVMQIENFAWKLRVSKNAKLREQFLNYDSEISQVRYMHALVIWLGRLSKQVGTDIFSLLFRCVCCIGEGSFSCFFLSSFLNSINHSLSHNCTIGFPVKDGEDQKPKIHRYIQARSSYRTPNVSSFSDSAPNYVSVTHYNRPDNNKKYLNFGLSRSQNSKFRLQDSVRYSGSDFIDFYPLRTRVLRVLLFSLSDAFVY